MGKGFAGSKGRCGFKEIINMLLIRQLKNMYIKLLFLVCFSLELISFFLLLLKSNDEDYEKSVLLCCAVWYVTMRLRS